MVKKVIEERHQIKPNELKNKLKNVSNGERQNKQM